MRTNLLLSTAVVALLGATSAFAGSNTVYFTQTDSGQNAQINQTGGFNTIGYSWRPFIQQNGGLSGQNALTINQSGSNNWVARDAQGYQSGTQNNAAINQSGNGNDIELQQSGTQNGYGYVAYNNGGAYNSIVQDGTATSSKVSVVQNGYRNGFDVLQGGLNNNTSLNQSGNGGVAYVRQGTWGGDQSTGRVIGPGSNNSIAINQTTGTASGVIALQGSGDGNSMNIGQSGDQLYVNAYQQGFANQISSTQAGVFSNASIVQVGNNNNVQSYQGNYALATLTQTGNGNQIYGTQINGVGGYQNVATVTQNGSNNYANYGQDGYANNINLSQTNDGNISVTAQNGVGNVLNIVQN
ncbi:curlin [Rhizobium sp. 2MFCol3.1]|uniref:curlin n=1 Tax=Rhizobium sp. 2MFCol3.1 TaxID=1246459 RepID=UPI0003A71548|nr:curlin [Rhizobium sp. 2MFCol3.1]